MPPVRVQRVTQSQRQSFAEPKNIKIDRALAVPFHSECQGDRLWERGQPQ